MPDISLIKMDFLSTRSPVRGTFRGDLVEVYVITPVPITIIHATDLNILQPGNRFFIPNYICQNENMKPLLKETQLYQLRHRTARDMPATVFRHTYWRVVNL
jgi:hypothetical protein